MWTKRGMDGCAQRMDGDHFLSGSKHDGDVWIAVAAAGSAVGRQGFGESVGRMVRRERECVFCTRVWSGYPSRHYWEFAAPGPELRSALSQCASVQSRHAGGRCRVRRPLQAAGGFFFQAEDGIRDLIVTGVQTCALPI